MTVLNKMERPASFDADRHSGATYYPKDVEGRPVRDKTGRAVRVSGILRYSPDRTAVLVRLRENPDTAEWVRCVPG